MSNKKRSSFASFICAVYIITLVVFIISVVFDISKGKEAAEKRFRKLTNETTESLKVSNPRSEAFYSSFLNSLGTVSDLAGVQIKDAQGLILSYPADLGTEGIRSTGKLAEPFTKSTKLNAQNGQEVTLTAAIYLLKPIDMYKKLRLSFLVILAATLLCLLYLIYTSIYGSSEETKEEETEEIIETEEEEPSEVIKTEVNSSDQVGGVTQPAIQQTPSVIVNVNAIPSGEVMTEKTPSDNRTPDNISNENDEVRSFGNYELTQEEYDGLLADEIDDKDDDDFDLDEDEDLELESENESNATILERPEEQKELLDLDTEEQDDELFDSADDDDDDFLVEDEPSFVPSDGFDEDGEEPLAAEEKTLAEENSDGWESKEEDEDIPNSEEKTILEENTDILEEETEYLPADDEDILDSEEKKIPEEDKNDDFPATAVAEPEHASTVIANEEKKTASEDDELFDSIEETDNADSDEDLTDDDRFADDGSDKDFFLADEEKTSDNKNLEEERKSENKAPLPLSAEEQEDNDSLQENKEWTPQEIPEIDDDIFEAEDDEFDIELDAEDEPFADETNIEANREIAESDSSSPEDSEISVDENNDNEIVDEISDESKNPNNQNQNEETTVEDENEYFPDDDSLFDDDELQDKDDILVEDNGNPESDESPIIDESDKENTEKTVAEAEQENKTEEIVPETSIEEENVSEVIAEPVIETEVEPVPEDETVIEEKLENGTEDSTNSETDLLPETVEPIIEAEAEIETEPLSEPEAKTEQEIESETTPATDFQFPQEISSAAVTKDSPDSTPTKPSGLYSDLTGFGWESYMIHRIDNEILRCTKTNQDISVISARIEDLDWASGEGKAACKCISELFNSPDLIFEKGKDAFTVALPDTNINEAIATAEDLYSAIDETLAKYGNDSPIGIGISARSLRMISGERLTNEAEVALNHAMEDDTSPIVAFKVDPQKYRNFLASQAEKEANPL